MHSAVRLPMSFNPDQLKDNLRLVRDNEWVMHFVKQNYEGEWSVAPLRSVGGISNNIYPDPTADTNRYAETGILTRCTYFKKILDDISCPLLAARLMKLKAGSSIKEHRDYNLGYDDGEIRIHIPVITDSAVEFYLDSKRLIMNEGECWYADFNLPHKIINNSKIDRVHLVIDCKLNDWMKSVLENGTPFTG